MKSTYNNREDRTLNFMVMAAIGKIIDSNPVVGGRTTNQILDTWKD